MNITKTYSNLHQEANYTDKTVNSNSNTYSSYNSANTTDIDKQEDEILYQHLKAAGCDLENHSLEFYKKGLVSFPPVTAPRNVRRAYRLALENSTPEEKKAAGSMVFYMYIYKTQTGNDASSNDVNGYLDLMKNFKKYFTRYEDKLDGNQYDLANNFLDNYNNELSKYTFKK